MKSLFNVKKHFAIFAIMATAMMLPNFAYAGDAYVGAIKGTHNVDDNGKCGCSTCKSKDYYIIVYKADRNIDLGHDNGAAKKSPFDLTHYAGYAAVSLNSVSGYFGWFFDDAVSEAIKAKNQNSASNSLGVTDLVLPAGFETIDAGAFAGYDGLTSISLPSTVKTIEAGAFQGCSSLTEVTIPGSCETIGNNAFQGCTSLKTVKFEESNEGVTLEVGAGAFGNCTKLEKVVVESESVKIDDSSFSGSNNISEVSGSLPQVEAITGVAADKSKDQQPQPQVNVKDLKLALTDGLDLSLYPNAKITTDSYTREGVSNAWGTICLPFDVESNQSIQYYQLSSVDPATGVMSFAKMDEVKANTPCVFQNLSGEATLEFSSSLPAEMNKDNVEYRIFEDDDWYIIGTYQNLVLNVAAGGNEEGQNLYYISNNKFWHATGTLRMKPFRAYFQYKGSSLSAAASRFSVAVSTNEMSTDLRSSSIEEEDGALYDLLGNRVTNMVEGRIYILNGKKVMFK